MNIICKNRFCKNVIGCKNKKYCSNLCRTKEKYFRLKELNGKEVIEINNNIENKTIGDFLNSKIKINISYRNLTHYLKLGYKAILNNDLEINIIDLPTSSHVKIDAICKLCGSINNINYCKYISNINRQGFYGCRSCSREKFRMTRIDKGFGYYIDKNDSKLKNAISKKNSIIFSKSENFYKEIYNEDYLKYRNEVRKLSKLSCKLFLKSWDGKDYYDNEIISDNFNLNHNNKLYPTFDHKISIYNGYLNKIPPNEISDISNLCITKRGINSKKRDNNYLDLEK